MAQPAANKSDAKKPRRRASVSPARKLAFEVCREVRVREAFAHELLATALAEASLSPADASFARVLVLGVQSTIGTLDELLNGVLKKPTDIDDEVRDCLRLSAYELFFLNKASHAAVNEGVELVRSVRKQASGVANFVLRRLQEKRADFPFGDPATDNAALARQYGFPRWIADMLVDTYGRESAATFMAASNEPAPVFLAVNTNITTDDAVAAALSATEVKHAQVKVGEQVIPRCLRLENGFDVSNRVVQDLLASGRVIVSDASAQAIAQVALPSTSNARMLEVGAGRGTKTILLQSGAKRALGVNLDLTSVDSYGFKTNLLTDRLAAHGIHAGRAVTADAKDLFATFGAKKFTDIFIDAPCSGLGTLRRHPEIRWRMTPQGCADLAEIGYKMLLSAAGQLEPGGVITYATCTVTPEENRQVIARFLASDAGKNFTLEPIYGAEYFAPALTFGGCDAHFAVRLRSRG